MLIVGSQALSRHLSTLNPGALLNDLDCYAYSTYKKMREPKDLDLFIFEKELPLFASWDYVRGSGTKQLRRAPDGRYAELEVAVPGSSTLLYLSWAETIARLPQIELYGMKMDLPPLELLYSLKRAHRHSPRAFSKHVRDYNLLRHLVKGQDTFSRVTDMRYKETVARENLKTPSLNKTAKEFFDDNVSNRTFVHDEIHQVMAHENEPMFEKIKLNPTKVSCSKEKFFALSPVQRRWCVQEEAYVIALERAIIPMLFEGGKIATPLRAFEWAVMRICTTLCSGWFREYAVEHYDEIIFWYDRKYPEKFLNAVEFGRIKRIN